MRSLTKHIVGAAAALTFFAAAMPAQAAGLTSDQINSVVSLLQSFGVSSEVVSTVQNVLQGRAGGEGMGMASSTEAHMPPGQIGKAMCVTLNRNLGVGSQGDDVRELQDLLADDPETGFTASSTGYFGPMTAKALMYFQMKNGIASSTTGFAGPLTRGFFERRCGKGLGEGSDHGGKGGEGDHGPMPTPPIMVGTGTPPMMQHEGGDN